MPRHIIGLATKVFIGKSLATRGVLVIVGWAKDERDHGTIK
jgi:hypothetical protein